MAKTFKDALHQAQTDHKFAQELVMRPESLKATYGLSDSQIQQLKQVGAAASKLHGPVKGIGGAGPASEVHYE